jgi:molybdenum cofactor cytidylyltransferase
MIPARAVILAAGTSSRVGKQKLLMNFRGRALIEYPIAAAQAWNPIVVAGPEVAAYLLGRSDVVVVRNDEPQLGMAHSLALADKLAESDAALIVLLGDKPLVSEELIQIICDAAADADVVYPLLDGVRGHPVRLSPRARRRIADLPPGDTLRTLSDRPDLRRSAVETTDRGATFDVDTLAEFDTRSH